jgi:hypothetical protein
MNKEGARPRRGVFFGFCRHNPFPAIPLHPLPRTPVLGRAQSSRNGARPRTGAERTAAVQAAWGVRQGARRVGNRACKHSTVPATFFPSFFAPAFASPRSADQLLASGGVKGWRKAGEYGRYKRAIARGWPLGGRSKAAGEASRVFRSPPLDRRSEEALQRPGKRDFARMGLRRASRPGPSHLWSAPEHPAWRLDRAGCWGRREGPAKELKKGAVVWLKKGAVVWQEMRSVYTPSACQPVVWPCLPWASS